jgi:hypothetical protein
VHFSWESEAKTIWCAVRRRTVEQVNNSFLLLTASPQRKDINIVETVLSNVQNAQMR